MVIGWASHLAWAAEPVRRSAVVLELLDRAPGETPRIRAARLALAGDFAHAAELFAELGSPSEEALARLRAAERLMAEGRRTEADEQLTKALAFYRSVGASRYIRQGEALLNRLRMKPAPSPR